MAEVDYPAILTEAWAQHLTPRTADAPTVVSLFAGCGGSSLGYSMAGFRELLAVEWDNNAVETFRLNFPGVTVWQGDIAKLSVEECLHLISLEPGQLDVLDGSPPCQGFSTAGKRVLTDPRNDLFREYVRLLRGLKPRAFVMENVSGMVRGKMKLVFAEAMRDLKSSGYRVSCRLLDAKWFGVPQSRRRLIWVGARDDLGIKPGHPQAQRGMIPAGEALGFGGTVTDGFASGISDLSHPIPMMRAQRALTVTTRSMRINPWMEGAAATICRQASDYQIRIGPAIRRLTIGEAKLLGSFPEGFRLVGSFSRQWAAIGNSVPPLFMRAIANHLRATVLEAA